MMRNKITETTATEAKSLITTHVERVRQPETVTALQLTRASSAEFCEFTSGIRQPTSFLMVWVPTCGRNAFEGEWAVRHANGLFTIAKPGEFLRTYDPA